MELIERDGFLDLLQTQLNNTAAGEGHCLFISGEAGIGKTTLVKAFLKQQADSCLIYQGACDALFTPRPLAPLHDILWHVSKDRWPVSTILEERSALFANFFQELSTKEKQLLIVFEDIHWADEATLDFIKFFARRISQLPCLFILTYRDDEIHSRHPLRNVLGQLPPDSFTKISITPLSKQAVEKMAMEKGYSGEDVYSISGGNPFYVNEILASYSPGVPDNIKDSILSVYDRQEEGTRHAWQICSVIPEGLEVNRFAKIRTSWDEAVDHCFAMNVIIVKNNKVVFKHELYRRTIEESLSPFKRIELNKKILELLLTSFEDEGEIERIVHYAKNANDKKLVVKYAPLAAKQAAAVGAHIEAAKLFLSAIEYYQENDKDTLIQFYESYAYQCYLTNQLKDAIIYAEKSLKLLKEKNEVQKICSCMRLLSWYWWFECNGTKAEFYATEAIDLLASQPSSPAKAMAFAHLGRLKMLSDQKEECLLWSEKAKLMAEELSNEEVLCYVLNSVGFILSKNLFTRKNGLDFLNQSKDIALKNNDEENIAYAWANLGVDVVVMKDFQVAKKILDEGIQFCEERDIGLGVKFLLTYKARLALETGNWKEAYSSANNYIKDENWPPVCKIGALVVVATIRMRCGANDVLPILTEAKEKAFKNREPQRILPVMSAMLEYEWITGKEIIKESDLDLVVELVKQRGNIYDNSAFAYWLVKARNQKVALPEHYEAYLLNNHMQVHKAAELWKTLGCPYEQALALFEGTDDDKRVALSIFQQLGADAVYEKTKMNMRAAGIKKIPRGLRESTKTNPAQLTNRELDILQLLQHAVQNKEIASTLYISPKTVDHHISNILFKLDVHSRSKAVTEAVRLGILK